MNHRVVKRLCGTGQLGDEERIHATPLKPIPLILHCTPRFLQALDCKKIFGSFQLYSVKAQLWHSCIED